VLGGLAALLTLAAFAVVAIFGSTQAVATDDNVSGATASDFGYVLVMPGSSLWQVAAEIDPTADPRDLVAEIVRLNQLGGSDVQAGQPIAVPLRYADAPGVVSGADLGI